MLSTKDAVLAAYRQAINMLDDTSEPDDELAALSAEADATRRLTREYVEHSAHSVQGQGVFQRKSDGLFAQLADINARIAEAQTQKAVRMAKKIAEFLKLLERRDGLIQTFDEELWYATVQQVTVHAKGKVAVTFKNGKTVDVGI